MVVAEQRLLPSAETVEGHWHGDGHVDADHADLDGLGEVAGHAAIVGEQRDAVTVLVGVDHAGGGCDVRRAHHAEHRPEDFLLVDAHVGRDIVEQASAEEKAVLVALQLQIAAVDNQFRAFLDAEVDVAAHFRQMFGGDQRPHLGFLIDAWGNLQRAHPWRQFGYEFVARRSDCDRNGHRHATLPGGAIGGAHQRIHGIVDIGVGHHHHVVLRPAQRLHALTGGGAALVDGFRDGGGADEADRGDAGVSDNGFHRFPPALHHGEHAVGQAGFLEQRRQFQGDGRVLFRGLEDEAIAGRQRDWDHPKRHHDWKIERRDAGHYTQRLPDGPRVDAGAHRVGVFPAQQMGYTASEFDHFEAALHLAVRIGQHLAVFGRDDRRHLGAVAVQQFLQFEHHAGAAQGRGRRPGRPSGVGGGDGDIDFARVGQRHATGDLTGGRVEYVPEFTAGARDELAADEVSDLAHGPFLICP